jgi:polar amino acid transport system permease protein
MISFNQFMLLLRGAQLTLSISILGMLVGSLIGVVFGLFRASKNSVMRNVSRIYVEIFRSSPLIIQLFIIYYGMPILLNKDISAYSTAFIAMTLYTSAYMAEVFKASIEAINITQWESAYSLGLSYPTVAIRIILPQALKIAIPPSIGVLILVIKDSSLASVVGFTELTRMSNIVRAQTFTTFDVYAVAALLYFVICYSISLLGSLLEKRFNINEMKKINY